MAAEKSTTSHPTSKKHSRRKKSRARGQQKIDSERATAIQQALIREHYLSGEPTGAWNQTSEDAMRRYQSDHGWQTKEVPDSRALIKLGLGPSKDGLLNPESAMTSAPETPRTEALPAAARSTTAAGGPAAQPVSAPASASPSGAPPVSVPAPNQTPNPPNSPQSDPQPN
ncbi:MAG TPA: peptidoglycan-binding protein [Verrucomicrobiae bacterium]|nr:peptidoglycan-binding protein [Verrucomicrobiae bacterium]